MASIYFSRIIFWHLKKSNYNYLVFVFGYEVFNCTTFNCNTLTQQVFIVTG